MTYRPDSGNGTYPQRILNAEAAHPVGYAALVTRFVALLLLWAWVELNYRPHAYQARTRVVLRAKWRKLSPCSALTPLPFFCGQPPRSSTPDVSHAYPGENAGGAL